MKKIITTIGLISMLSLSDCDIWGKESNYDYTPSYNNHCHSDNYTVPFSELL